MNKQPLKAGSVTLRRKLRIINRMTTDRWQEIVEQVRSTFEVEDSGVDRSDEHGGSTIEYIVFKGPVGKIKLEFLTHPVLLNTRTKYSNRIGSEVRVDNIYSETDMVSRLEVWRWDDANESWQPFDSTLFSN